jgi:starvation-inducible DNA-binding protein
MVTTTKNKASAQTPIADRTHARSRGGPVPSQLATPTDLAPDAVQAIAEAVNRLVADAVALWVKTKNYHWHLAGPHFRDYHLLFDEQAESILASVDLLAERVRKIGGTTIRSISQIGQLQRVADDNETFRPAELMVQHLLADNRQIAEMQRAAIDLCEEQRDTPTANLLQELLDQTERRIWFLFEISQSRSDTR